MNAKIFLFHKKELENPAVMPSISPNAKDPLVQPVAALGFAVSGLRDRFETSPITNSVVVVSRHATR